MDNHIQCFSCGVWYNPFVGHICHFQKGHCETFYNYKCPKCYGEFNEPARDMMGPPSHGNPRCPFCGLSMEGLK